MTVRAMTKIFVAAITLCLGLEIAFMPGLTNTALAFGHGGHGGGHGGGAHSGRFGRTHFGGLHLGARRFGRGHAFGHGRLGGPMAFARNRLGAAGLGRFHAIHGLDPHGFNRNAFGGMRGWNHWARNHWGAGWNVWGSGWGYWAGPVFWPFAYGDALTFALWPDALYDSFFAYGPDYLLSSIFWPGPLYGLDDYAAYPLFDVYGYPPDAENYYGYYHRRRHHRRHAVSPPNDATAANLAASCDGLAPGVADLPIDRIKKAIKATVPQVKMLDELQAASAKADAILRSSCPSEVPLTPVGRLDAVAKRLHAMVQAIALLRAPLVTLDGSLDDTQREKLAGLGRHGRRRHEKLAPNAAPARDLAALCKPQSGSFTHLPVQRIEDIVKPTAQQTSAFAALKSASTMAAANLDASCPVDVPETLADRLDAVVKRLNALADAVKIVKPALTQFYGTLSDEQKARFNVIGGANDAP